MTLSELGYWRKGAPFFIFGLCILPWFVVSSKNLEEVKLLSEIVVPSIALVAAFFYVGADLGRSRWKAEVNKYVGVQIEETLSTMVPAELAVTPIEMNDLKEEIFGELTGVFWEAVEGNDLLRGHKEHFYSNGIVYSTSIDVFLIFSFAGFAYACASVVYTIRAPLQGNTGLACAAAVLLAVGLAARFLVLPRARQKHLKLSKEQLALVQREEGGFVSGRFEEIIFRWRRNRLLQG
jgi:hypothetical protein